MGGLTGKKSNNTATKLSGIQVQSSVYGRAIPRVFGTARVTPNLIWYNNFRAIAQTSKTKSGGKGGGGQTNTTYTYQAALIMGLCAGPIAGVRKIFKDKSIFTDGATTALQQAGLSLALGTEGQTTWPYLTANYPDQAMPYAGLAYAYAPSYALGDQANITNHGFEVVSTIKAAGRDDCAPADIIEGVTNSLPLWQGGLLADLTNYRNYCIAAGFWFSLAQQEQVAANELLAKLLKASNSEAVWSGGQFKIVPYGDTQITKDGVTWTPDLTPIYDIDDSITNDLGDQDPIIYSRTREADYFNQIQVDYLDRARDYADANVPAEDPAGIADYGLRKASAAEFDFICDKAVAESVAQALIGRMATIRREFEIELPPQYCLLEPMDLITITREELELDRALVRILRIDENEEGDLTAKVEEVLVGAATGAIVTRQIIDGYKPNFDADSGNAAAPQFIKPPRQMTEGGLEMWIATSGGANWGGAEIWASLDGTTYERKGQIEGPARYGVTTTALASASDPHNASLGVNILASGGTLDPATQAEFNAGVTLCMVDQEVIAYRDATLTAAGQYTLGWLRRGLFGTAIAAHAAGAPFVRLDAAVTSLPFLQSDIGRTIYIKLRSYNAYGRRYQDISTLTAYQAVLGQDGAFYVSTGAAAKIGTNLLLPDQSVAPVHRIDNLQITANPNGSLANIGTSIIVDNSKIQPFIDAANADIAAVENEILLARNGQATLQASIAAAQAAAQAVGQSALDKANNLISGAVAAGTANLLGTLSEGAINASFSTTNANVSQLQTQANGLSTALTQLTQTESTNNAAQAVQISNMSATLNSNLNGGSGYNVLDDIYASFENNTLPPLANNSTGVVTLDASNGYVGFNSLKIVANASNAYSFFGSSTSNYNIALSPNRKWILSAYVKSDVASATGSLRLRRDDGAYAGPFNFTTSATIGVWTRVSAVIDLSAYAGTKAIILPTNNQVGAAMWFDGFMLEEQTGTATTPSAWVNGQKLSEIVQAKADITTLYAADITINSALGTKASAQSVTDLTATVNANKGSYDAFVLTQAGINSAQTATNISLSASIGATGNYLTRNPEYTDWPAGAALPNNWTSPYPATDITITKIAGTNGRPNAIRLASASTNNAAIFQNAMYGAKGGEWLVADVELTLVAGNLQGAGAYFYAAQGGTSLKSLIFPFHSTPDASGNVVGAGVAGQRYSWKKLLDGRYANVEYYYCYLMARYSTWAPVGAVTIDFHKCAIRPASAAEIQANQAATIDIPAAQASITNIQATKADTTYVDGQLATKASAQTLTNVIASLGSNYSNYSNFLDAQTATNASNATSLTSLTSSATNLKNAAALAFSEAPSLFGWTTSYATFEPTDYSSGYLSPLAAANRYGGPKAVIPVKAGDIIEATLAVDFTDLTGASNVRIRYVIACFDKAGAYINYQSLEHGTPYITATGLYTYKLRFGFAAQNVAGATAVSGNNYRFTGVAGQLPANCAFIRILGGWLSTNNATALVKSITYAEVSGNVTNEASITSLAATEAANNSAQATLIQNINAQIQARPNLIVGGQPIKPAANANWIWTDGGWDTQGSWYVTYSNYLDGEYISHGLTTASNFTWNSMNSNSFSVTAGLPISVQAVFGKYGTWNAGQTGMFIRWYNSAGSNFATTNFQDAFGTNTTDGAAIITRETWKNSAANKLMRIENIVPPANAVSAKIAFALLGVTGNGSYTEAAIYRVKAEIGTACTLWTDTATLTDLRSGLITESAARLAGDTAIATRTDKVFAEIRRSGTGLSLVAPTNFDSVTIGATPAADDGWGTMGDNCLSVPRSGLPSTGWAYVNYGAAKVLEYSGATAGFVFPHGCFRVRDGMIFQPNGSFRVSQNPTSGSVRIYVGVMLYNSAGTYIGTYFTQSQLVALSNGLVTVGGIDITLAAIKAYNSGVWADTTYVAPAAYLSYPDPYGAGSTNGAKTQMKDLWLTDRTDLQPLQASVTTISSAQATTDGKVNAFFSTTATAGSKSAEFVIGANADESYFIAKGDKFFIKDSAGNNIAVFQGGKLAGSYLRNAKATPTAGSNIYHDIMLKPLAVLGAHGATVQWQGGAAYDYIPNPRPDPTFLASLPSLAAGERYIAQIEQATTSQGVVKFGKESGATNPVAQSTGAGTATGGLPSVRAQKPTSADAVDYTYTFSITIVANAQYVYGEENQYL